MLNAGNLSVGLSVYFCGMETLTQVRKKTEELFYLSLGMLWK